VIELDQHVMQKQRGTSDDMETESVRLARSFLADDRRAFDKLILLHKTLVFNLCYRLLGDYDEANDCAQEVFIKVSQALKGFRFESSFRSWLYRITVNTCKNRLHSLEYRFRSRKIRLSVAQEMNNGTQQTEIVNGSQSPEADFERKRIGRLIQAAVSALPPRQKLVVVLRDIEGRSYEEIVELTGFKLGTVKSKLSRARQQLRGALEGKL